MRLIDVDEAKKQIKQMQTLKASERVLFQLALDRTPTYKPPNNPLTLEQLREMDGEPVWCVSRGGESRWGIVHVYGDCSYEFECYTMEYGRIVGGSYGMDGMDCNDGWLAYRRKKEEGTDQKCST